jgi:hypothetical protein
MNLPSLRQPPRSQPFSHLLDLHRCLAREAKRARDERYLRTAKILAGQARDALATYRASIMKR